VKEGWEVRPIVDVAFIQEGPGIRKYEYQDNGYPMINVRCVQDGYIDMSKARAANIDLATGKWKHFQVENGDILFTISGTIGRCAIVEETDLPLLMNTSVVRFRSTSENLDRGYFYYFLKSEGFQAPLKALSSGTAIQNVGPSHIKTLSIPIPPIEEQRRIVAVLDKAFAAIATATANAQKNLTNAQDIFESYLQAVFSGRGKGWKEFNFDEVCKISAKLVDPRLPDHIDLPHVGAGNMVSRTGEIFGVQTAREEKLKSGKFLFDDSVVLYSKIRPYLMKACRPSFTGLCSADVYPLEPKAGLLERDMLFHILMSADFTNYAEAGSARAGMPKVNRKHLFNYSLWLPDVYEQQKICNQLDQLAENVRALASLFQSKLTALSELKQSLLQQAFAGELTAIVAASPTPTANDNFATPRGTAQIIAFAHHRHQMRSQQQTFGHVKTQKALHLVESIGGIELGRQPIKDAAGPNDFQHMLRATDWAAQNGFFVFERRANSKGYDFKKLPSYDTLWAEAVTATKPIAAALEQVIDAIVPMDTRDAELFATVHAAWNNLIRDGANVTDDAIAKEARENWHEDKRKIPIHKFHEALKRIRAKDMEPDGSAKYVGGQGKLI